MERGTAMTARMLVLLLVPLAAALPHSPQELVPLDRLGEKEPSCDQLRAMWRFSKRQSRAAQITNEIPTYRDPFAYPLWESLQAGREGQGLAGGPAYGDVRFRNGARPVYGRVVQQSPPRWRNSPAGRIRIYDDSSRMYNGQPSRTSRISGGGLPPQQTGSFQHLKEIIRQERMRELQEQRMAEEAAAARQLKENSKPHFGRVINGPASSLDLVLASNNNNKRAGGDMLDLVLASNNNNKRAGDDMLDLVLASNNNNNNNKRAGDDMLDLVLASNNNNNNKRGRDTMLEQVSEETGEPKAPW